MFFKSSLLCASLLSSVAFATKVVGIVVPIALPAMDQIVSGFEKQLQKSSPEKIEFLVKNAQGSALIQQSILQEFIAKPVDLIAPIGTDATEMAIHLDHTGIPIVAIAADRPQNLSPKTPMTNVLDEVSVASQLQFIHQALPNIHKLTLIYSADDRIFEDVKTAKKAADALGIKLQLLMIQQLSDLYTVQSHLDSDTQGIFILKDELVVSGVQTLLNTAEKRHIPVIASDDGSVQNGAGLALGVEESEIGKLSALSAARILSGTPAAEIPSVTMTHYTVFVNSKTANARNLNLKKIQKIAKSKGFSYVDLAR